MKHFLPIIVLLCFVLYGAQAQSPGGVGTSNLLVWLRADGYTTGAWQPKYPTGASTQYALTGTSPTTTSAALNFNPTLRFNGSTYFKAPAVSTNITEAFVVGKLNDNSTSGTGAMIGTTFNGGIPTSGYRYFFHIEGGYLYEGGNGKDATQNADPNYSYWYTSQYVNSSGTTGVPYVLLNGSLAPNPSGNQANPRYLSVNATGSGAFTNFTNSTLAASPIYPIASDVLTIGARFTASTTSTVFEPILNGSEIAEVIIYKADQTGTNRQKIQSYLALKYGLTLNAGTATSYTASDGTVYWTGNATYQNNIIGIGRDDNSVLAQRQSTSVAVSSTSPYTNPSSFLTIALGDRIQTSNAANTLAFPNDKAFFVVGDNNQSTTTFGSSITASVNGRSQTYTRMSRTWLLQKTSWPDQSAYPEGSITFQINNATTANTIIIGSDANLNASTPAGMRAYPISGGKAIVPSWALLNAQYFTFANFTNPLILPITYDKPLSVRQSSGWNVLEWTTATEINNKGFDVQRSGSASGSWNTIGNVPSYFENGTGNGHAYSIDDKTPLSGINYYRLVQVDFDGKTATSNVVSISYDGKATLQLFPNPAYNDLNLLGIKAGDNIKVYSMSGVLMQAIISSGSPQKINVSSFPAGVYLVQILAKDGSKNTLKFIKR